MNWFKRHLNWTILIVFVIGLILPFSIGFAGMEILSIILFIFQAVILIIACAWVLKQKGRSLWNLLWLLVGWLGIFLFLGMDNLKCNVLEADRKTVDCTPGVCPYCGDPNPKERKKKGPYDGEDWEAFGYTYLWDCHCYHCGEKWYALER